MVESQQAAYGDGLDPEVLHPYMWAVKPHYYSTSYYNWPYTYGLLFGIGLYSRFQRDPDEWVTGDESVTGPQASYLKTLATEAGEDVDEDLTKAEASKKIEELQERTGRGRDH